MLFDINGIIKVNTQNKSSERFIEHNSRFDGKMAVDHHRKGIWHAHINNKSDLNFYDIEKKKLITYDLREMLNIKFYDSNKSANFHNRQFFQVLSIILLTLI